ncbi:hypothetical protein, partial [Mesorhizobium sp. M3A.F.Ca.ET.174.01.1.1]|uniref:hypothetical protein n=1 Tax=Mesorhizobium sp. M3A.F.Ca.ET.174.01.1.1 TaxID=2563944 RepID=UPI001AEE917E
PLWKGACRTGSVTETDQRSKEHEQSFRPKGRCPDRSVGTMGEAISLRVLNLPNQGSQGREPD